MAMKKFLFSLLGLVVAVGVILIVTKDLILKTGMEQVVTLLTGFKTKIEYLRYDFPSAIHMRGLEIENPEGFQEKVFTSIPEIYISLVLTELLEGKRAHLPEVRLNIQEVHIEKNADGISNVELLSSVGGKAGKRPAAPAEKPSEKKPPMPFLLEHLDLTIRNVSYEDRSGIVGAVPLSAKKLAVDLNVQHEVFTDIQEPQALVNVILAKILSSATLGKFLNLSPEDLFGENLSSALAAGQELVGKQAGAVQEQLGAVTESEVAKKAGTLAEQTLGGTKEAVTGSTAAVKEQISGLFGKLKSSNPTEESAQKTQ
jgi:hypothetical protein